MTRRTNSLDAVRKFYADNPDARPTSEELGAKLSFSPRTIETALRALTVKGVLRRASVWHRRVKA